jgi:hypothetical protein
MGTMIKRILIFSLLMGGLGLVLNFLFARWGISETSANENTTSSENETNDQDDSNSDTESLKVDDETNSSNSQEKTTPGDKNLSNEQANDFSGNFDYTVKDDEDLVFQPLDNTLIEQTKKKYLEVDGEKIEYDPKKAAMAIKQLLKESESDDK